jgi:hypothetical protein
MRLLITLACAAAVLLHHTPARAQQPARDEVLALKPFADVPLRSPAYRQVARLVQRLGLPIDRGCGGSGRALTRYEFAVYVQQARTRIRSAIREIDPAAGPADVAHRKHLPRELLTTLASRVRFRSTLRDVRELAGEFAPVLAMLQAGEPAHEEDLGRWNREAATYERWARELE